MGNSGGNLKEYFKAFRQERSCQGGKFYIRDLAFGEF